MKPPSEVRRAPALSHWLGAGWVLLFLVVCLRQPLPNGNIPARSDLLPLLPFQILDAIDPPEETGQPPRRWANVAERLPLIAVGAVIVVAAWGLGQTLLSTLRLAGVSATERHYFAILIGFGASAIVTLGLGLAGGLSTALFWLMHLLMVAVGVAVWFRSDRGKATSPGNWRSYWWVLAASPFLLGMLLGSLSPSTDFDVNEYHLGGPKEWYLAGHIHFLDHDIYTSFPFLTEMLLLNGMVLSGDWFWGSLAGQAALMTFAPLTAIGIWLAGRRWFSDLVGGLAAWLYLCTPWVFRISIIAYAEGGLVAFVFGTTFASLIALEQMRNRTADASAGGDWRELMLPHRLTGNFVLAGLCAGGAMACKYTGLVMAVVPWMAVLALVSYRQARQRLDSVQYPIATLPRGWRLMPRLKVATYYLLGVSILVGPWLLKNFCETGNPVYPLAYSVFGGRGLDDTLNAQWRRGHARPKAGSIVGEVRDFIGKAFDVAAVNDWQNPLLVALAPLACLWPGEKRRILALFGITVWLFLCWWLLTHHLDRFWLPLLPSLALLAGIGVASLLQTPAKWFGVAVLAAGGFWNLGFVSTRLVGFNAGLIPLANAADLASRRTGPEIRWINAAIEQGTLPPETTVLCVGEAALFHARFPYFYNTVFDRSLFEEWFAAEGTEPPGERPLKSADEILSALRARKITHIFVNWGEILRYRQPYSYGYSDFVQPRQLEELVALGVLTPVPLPDGIGRFPIGSPESESVQLARRWAPELIVPCGDQGCLVTGALYAVRPPSP